MLILNACGLQIRPSGYQDYIIKDEKDLLFVSLAFNLFMLPSSYR